MSGSLVVKKGTYKIPETGPSHDLGRPHVCIALTNPDQNGEILLVPICTIHGAHDPACLLNKGDHVDVQAPSFVQYQLWKRLNATRLQAMIDNGTITFRGILADDVFSRVAAGMRSSEHVTTRTLKYFEQHIRNRQPPEKGKAEEPKK